MAENQAQIEQLDREQAKLLNGEVANNFYLPKLGYYHATAKDFFEHPYGFEKDGKFYVDGKWQDTAVAEYAGGPTRPSPEALKKIELVLEGEQITTCVSTSQHPTVIAYAPEYLTIKRTVLCINLGVNPTQLETIIEQTVRLSSQMCSKTNRKKLSRRRTPDTCPKPKQVTRIQKS